jgi:hypothetical protein
MNRESTEVCSASNVAFATYSFLFVSYRMDREGVCGEIKFCGFVRRRCGLAVEDRYRIGVMLGSGQCTRIE